LFFSLRLDNKIKPFIKVRKLNFQFIKKNKKKRKKRKKKRKKKKEKKIKKIFLSFFLLS
jgi:hypothetical protein